MEKETFLLETEEGTLNCEVILRFYLEEYQKNYLVYTDHSMDESGEENVFVSSYIPNDEEGTLTDIIDENELERIMTELEKILGEEDGI